MNKTDNLREGFTTGACAAAAAKAATILLCDEPLPETVDIPLRNGGRAAFAVNGAGVRADTAFASVVKDSGDDPDITNGATVTAAVSWMTDGDIIFAAGEGVGTVTKKGLSIPPGEPAINPGPRTMIRAAVREVTGRPVHVELSIPGGDLLAARTFNPRLGIVGGLSVLGTTGIVRPYSHPALRESLKCTLDVALGGGLRRMVFTAGNIGTNVAMKSLGIMKDAVIEVSNEWGFMLDCLERHDIDALLVVGHPGKLAKLPAGEWDTHSSRSASAIPYVRQTAREVMGADLENANTVEEIIENYTGAARTKLASALAEKVAAAVAERTKGRFAVSVALVNMKGEVTGAYGDLGGWTKKNL
ncbi:MAG: cobalamin biosynthesis protein CbiD [Nitrospinae bacterium]|nr:cobalamin biosynthesis protein CbiD [Nitrospinota bacterium]